MTDFAYVVLITIMIVVINNTFELVDAPNGGELKVMTHMKKTNLREHLSPVISDLIKTVYNRQNVRKLPYTT
jgi:hypothetical protein